MLAGALGIDRTDRERLLAMEGGYSVGVAARKLGPLLVDYHTAQFVPGSAVRDPDSRAQAMSVARAKRKIGTILSHREYHEDCVFDVVVTASADAAWTLQELAERLREPRFVPYFGRKACPLDRPMHPLIVEADDVAGALEVYARERPALSGDAVSGEAYTARFDPELLDEEDRTRGRSIRRRDGVADRQRWLFVDREVVEVRLGAGGGS